MTTCNEIEIQHTTDVESLYKVIIVKMLTHFVFLSLLFRQFRLAICKANVDYRFRVCTVKL